MTEQRIYREVFSSDRNARYIDMVLRFDCEREYRGLLKAKPGSERIQ